MVPRACRGPWCMRAAGVRGGEAAEGQQRMQHIRPPGSDHSPRLLSARAETQRRRRGSKHMWRRRPDKLKARE